jgi:hypothetical protein
MHANVWFTINTLFEFEFEFEMLDNYSCYMG